MRPQGQSIWLERLLCRVIFVRTAIAADGSFLRIQTDIRRSRHCGDPTAMWGRCSEDACSWIGHARARV